MYTEMKKTQNYIQDKMKIYIFRICDHKYYDAENANSQNDVYSFKDFFIKIIIFEVKFFLHKFIVKSLCSEEMRVVSFSN